MDETKPCMEILKKILKLILMFVVLGVMWIAGNLLFGTITDFKPEKEIKLAVRGKAVAQPDSIFSFINWNIGYGGLGEKADFFYDGGKMVVSAEEDVDNYLAGIYNFAKSNDSVDFFFFQEVDTLARRSYRINELWGISQQLPDYAYSFAVNYDVKFVPVPYTNPMGKVVAGLASFSKFQPTSATRYGYDSNFSWPTSIYFLDRCFLVHRIALTNGKEFIAINTHNSAYDKTGELKRSEMNMLKVFVLKEFEKGNYVVVGGDWNQCAHGFDAKTFWKSDVDIAENANIDAAFMPTGWTWAYDNTVPTNRSLLFPLDLEKTDRTVIDYYLVSPNLEVLQLKNIDMQFKFSDHQPVFLQVKIK